ncbi:MAG TPA: hypothetical protein PKI14_18870 [Fervidobacterium sp.]|nr:hypothetical protein [Fervidobacterium sp.]
MVKNLNQIKLMQNIVRMNAKSNIIEKEPNEERLINITKIKSLINANTAVKSLSLSMVLKKEHFAAINAVKNTIKGKKDLNPKNISTEEYLKLYKQALRGKVRQRIINIGKI